MKAKQTKKQIGKNKVRSSETCSKLEEERRQRLLKTIEYNVLAAEGSLTKKQLQNTFSFVLKRRRNDVKYFMIYTIIKYGNK